MGWRGDNLWAATRRAAVFFAAASAAVCGAGLFLGMLQRLPTHLIEPRRFLGYLAFCVLQQVGLNSFLTNRLLGALEKPVPAALVAGVLFAALHWPNPVLVPLTFVGGAAMAWLFARERNILPLALGQADSGRAGVVGVSAGVAPLDAGGAGVFDVWKVGGIIVDWRAFSCKTGGPSKLRASKPPHSKTTKTQRLCGHGAQRCGGLKNNKTEKKAPARRGERPLQGRTQEHSPFEAQGK